MKWNKGLKDFVKQENVGKKIIAKYPYNPEFIETVVLKYQKYEVKGFNPMYYLEDYQHNFFATEHSPIWNEILWLPMEDVMSVIEAVVDPM